MKYFHTANCVSVDWQPLKLFNQDCADQVRNTNEAIPYSLASYSNVVSTRNEKETFLSAYIFYFSHNFNLKELIFV